MDLFLKTMNSPPEESITGKRRGEPDKTDTVNKMRLTDVKTTKVAFA